MARGQYDRSKTKEERALDKTASPKRKYTKQTTKADIVGLPNSQKIDPFMGVYYKDKDFMLMQEVRSNIGVIMMVAEKFVDLPSVKNELDAHVSLLGKLRERVIGDALSTESETGDTTNLSNCRVPHFLETPTP